MSIRSTVRRTLNLQENLQEMSKPYIPYSQRFQNAFDSLGKHGYKETERVYHTFRSFSNGDHKIDVQVGGEIGYGPVFEYDGPARPKKISKGLNTLPAFLDKIHTS